MYLCTDKKSHAKLLTSLQFNYSLNMAFAVERVVKPKLCLYIADCDAGYWCIGGSPTATPTDGIVGKSCPEGNYCEAGVPVPEPCPQGTFSNTTGLELASQCDDCTAGSYCNTTGLTQPWGLCTAG